MNKKHHNWLAKSIQEHKERKTICDELANAQGKIFAIGLNFDTIAVSNNTFERILDYNPWLDKEKAKKHIKKMEKPTWFGSKLQIPEIMPDDYVVFLKNGIVVGVVRLKIESKKK